METDLFWTNIHPDIWSCLECLEIELLTDLLWLYGKWTMLLWFLHNFLHLLHYFVHFLEFHRKRTNNFLGHQIDISEKVFYIEMTTSMSEMMQAAILRNPADITFDMNMNISGEKIIISA